MKSHDRLFEIIVRILLIEARSCCDDRNTRQQKAAKDEEEYKYKVSSFLVSIHKKRNNNI